MGAADSVSEGGGPGKELGAAVEETGGFRACRAQIGLEKAG